MFSHSVDGDHDVVSGPCHNRGVVRVHRLVMTDGPAKGNGSLDLLVLGQSGLVFDVLSPFGLWWGQRETSEISVNLRWSGGRLRWWEEVSFRSRHRG
jgi:hypothetical protein